jgi:predicted PurR-regulated permease PerM
MFPPPTKGQARLLWFAASAVAVVVVLGVVCLLLWGVGVVLRVLSPVIWPLAVAGVLAYLLDPVVNFLEQRAVPRTRAIVVVFALALAIFAGAVGSLVPAIMSETRAVVSRSDEYAERVERKLDEWMSSTNSVLRRALNFLPGGLQGSTPQIQQDATTGSDNRVRAGREVDQPMDDLSPGQAESEAVAAAGDLVRDEEAVPSTPRFWEHLEAQGYFESATRWLAGVLPTVGRWFFGKVGMVASWLGLLVGLALVPVYLFYFLLEKRGISSQWMHYLPLGDSRLKDELVVVISLINGYLIAFFRGQVLVAICDGILYTIGFLLIGLPMAVLLGVAAMFLTVIPYLGAIVTCGSALIVAVVHFGDLWHPLLVLAVFGVVQALEGFVIQPKILGDRVGLHPLTIIVAVMVGTVLFGGILGGILAIPFTAALRVLMFRYVWKKRVPGSLESSPTS